jgi:hypothetical protein
VRGGRDAAAGQGTSTPPARPTRCVRHGVALATRARDAHGLRLDHLKSELN